MRRRTLGTLSALALTGLLAACGGDATTGSAGSSGSGSSQEALTFGTEGTYSPYSFHDPETDALTGYDVEVAKAVGEQLGRDVEFSENNFDSLFAGMEARRYDGIANQVSITPERQAKYVFSTPYTVSTGVVVTRADDTSVTSLADVRGKTSAQSLSSNWAQTATDAGAEVEGVEGLAQAVTLLKQGRVDVTINDNLAILDYLKTTGDTSIKIATMTTDTTEQGFVFRKGEEDTAQQVSDALATLKTDGTLATISQKWFGEDVSGPAAG
ncbi:transporter substrate-binding domain-containing protein [Kineococcus sp. R8]|uniref:amino acid ABC transporter substrate-binding protein n=1 Tax=Kineococcus siccus TaxID=2696567 RepID=UPI0014125FA3|nr:amino acid ABC transporter substrate-binding protein [Kineococcus siccus]NAZ82398.1 transporter substrate-binding domain-containing protein [Kineococcus siccus]